MIEFSNSLSRRFYLWKQFLNESNKRSGCIQFDDSGEYYFIYFYDGPEVFWTRIWKISVPSDIALRDGYSDEENTEDLVVFNLLKQYYNLSNIPRTKQGVLGSAAARGLGGFSPNPNNNPEEPLADEIVSLYADGEGSLVTRGYAITDEGSFREDFGGNNLFSLLTGTSSYVSGTNQITGIGTNFSKELSRDYYVRIFGSSEWNRVVRVPSDTSLFVENILNETDGTLEKTKWISCFTSSIDGNISVNSSHLIISGSSTISGATAIKRFADYGPMLLSFRCQQTQRLDGQYSFFGFKDDILNPEAQVIVQLDGTNSSQIKFVTSTVASETIENKEITTLVLPPSLTTENDLTYEISVTPEYCSLSVNGVILATHTTRIPGPYSQMDVVAGIINQSVASDQTKLMIDSVYFSNQNQLQIASSFTKPLQVSTREDLHTLTGKLITTSTTQDQSIISYTVPTGKIFYLMGYCVSSQGNASANPIKIGRNDISGDPSSGGSIDYNLFRVFNISSSSTGPTQTDFGSSPRRIATEGDVVKVAVSPSSADSTTWLVSLDYTLS